MKIKLPKFLEKIRDKKAHKKRKKTYSSEAEIERITTELIEETKKKLDKKFNKELRKVAKDNNLEKDFAERIIDLLLKEAIADRKMLIGRIEKDVESGDLFDRYYGKMQTINTLTNSAYASMQRMDVAEERYNYEREVYKKITGQMYLPDAKPAEPFGKRKKSSSKDILQIMDERKGSIEDGEDNG